MMQIRKKEGTIVKAYCLEENSPMIHKFMEEGKLCSIDENHWRIFSRESKEGELAQSGDYVKMDSGGNLYPTNRSFFLRNHRFLGEDTYEQISRPLRAWCAGDDMCPEVQFLMEHKDLRIHADDEHAYFSASLWGDLLRAAKDAVIVFYDIEYDAERTVIDADFNFVSRDEFEAQYDIVSS